jgi:ubiquinone/menaquinone biosynthesis C-methylase UbiE
MTGHDKFVTLGHPSYVWRRGQDRRLALIREHVEIEGRTILDIGCGIGTYVSRLRQHSHAVYGIDVDEEKARQAASHLSGIALGAAEALPYTDNTFDIVLLNEVIEHVRDDRATIREAVRCTRVGGSVVIFAPNRLYPFETHGFFVGERFVFRLLPLINYTPDVVRNRFCHHVRIYTQRGIKQLFRGLDVELRVCSHIYPGFDNIAARHGVAGRALQRLAEWAERTPMRRFGISHFVVAKKLGQAVAGAQACARFGHVPLRPGSRA